MLNSLFGLYGSGVTNPYIYIVVSILVGIFLFVRLSEQKTSASILGLIQITWLYFSTPFNFLKRVLRMSRNHKVLELPYQNTLQFLTYRWTRFLYIGIFISALSLLSVGAGTALISLYPDSEIQALHNLEDQVVFIQTELTTAKERVSQSVSVETLRSARNDRQNDYAVKRNNYDTAFGSIGWEGPLVTNISEATNLFEVERLKRTVDDYFSTCPGKWEGNISRSMCDTWKAKTKIVLEMKTAERVAREKLQEIERALTEAPAALKRAQSDLDLVQNKLARAQDYVAQASEDMKLLKWLPSHLKSAISTIGVTLVAFFIFVWSGAIFADVLAWVVLMMLSLEARSDTKKKDDHES